MKKVSGLGVIVAILALVFGVGESAGQGGSKLSTVKFGIPWPIADYLPFYGAMEQGYFRQENLAIDVTKLSTGDKLTFALIGKSIDIATYTPDWFIRAVEKGGRIRIVLGMSDMPVYSLIAAKETKAYAGLKGKRIAVSAVKASDAFIIRKMLAANGLREGDYSLIQAGAGSDRLAALKAGSVAATLLIPPYDQMTVDEGYTRLDVSTNVVRRYTWMSHAVREEWAEANRGTLLAFIRAWIRGTRWAYDPKHKDEAARILARELKLEDRYARKVYDMYFEAKTWAKDGEVDKVGLQAIIQAMVEQGEFTPPGPKVDKYIDLRHWEQAFKTIQ